MSKKKINEIISILLIILFVYAGASKLMEVELFHVQLSQSPILTDMAFILVWCVPLLEILIAGLLTFESTRLAGLYAFLSLMTVFTVYIILATKFSDYVPCSCGGIIQNLNWNQHLVFNICCVMLGLLGILLHNTKRTVRVM